MRLRRLTNRKTGNSFYEFRLNVTCSNALINFLAFSEHAVERDTEKERRRWLQKMQPRQHTLQLD
jgi:hypothetical protein